MSIEVPSWFDADYYAQQRIEQMNDTGLDGKTDWNVASYENRLAKYNMTPYEDFVYCNGADSLAMTNISPNPLFNVQEYLTALAKFANDTGYIYSGYTAGQWTAQKAMEHMFNDYHVSAWDHFTLAGQFDLVNPSNSFDISAYYGELVNYRNNYTDPQTGAKGWEGRADWTVQDVVNENIWGEINPVQGLYEQTIGTGITATPVPVSQKVTTDVEWNPWVPVTNKPQPEPVQPTPSPDWTGGGSSSSSSGGADTPALPSEETTKEIRGCYQTNSLIFSLDPFT